MDHLPSRGNAPTLMALYPLPPWRGSGAAPPDFVRLATMLELYAPAGAPQAAGAPQGAGAPPGAEAPPSGADGININRPPDGGGGSSSSNGSGASSTSPSAPKPPAPSPPPSLKRLLHDGARTAPGTWPWRGGPAWPREADVQAGCFERLACDGRRARPSPPGRRGSCREGMRESERAGETRGEGWGAGSGAGASSVRPRAGWVRGAQRRSRGRAGRITWGGRDAVTAVT
jgi:hypothetical protein